MQVGCDPVGLGFTGMNASGIGNSAVCRFFDPPKNLSLNNLIS